MRVLDRIHQKLMYAQHVHMYVYAKLIEITWLYIPEHVIIYPVYPHDSGFPLTHDCKQVVTYKRPECPFHYQFAKTWVPSGSRFFLLRNMKLLVFLCLLFVTLCAAQVRVNLMDYWFLDIYEKYSLYNMHYIFKQNNTVPFF